MAKKTTSGKKSYSHDTPTDDNAVESASLYGQVNALAPAENAPTRFASPSARSTALEDAGRSDSYGTAAMQNIGGEERFAAKASASFSVNKVYQHWADGDAMQGTSAEWNNNILSETKSDYFEGEVVPHVFYYKASNSQPLVNGQTYSFNVTYNYYQGNTNAGGFLFMTTPDLDRDPSEFSGTEPTTDASFTNGGGMLGSFQTVDANITGVSDVTYTTRGGGTMDGHVTITFVYTGPTTQDGGAEIQYGLMIASPGDVPDQGSGPTLGAAAWTGGSLQTTVDIDGKGAMSLQLMTSAIIEGEISGMKFNDMDGNGVRDADGVDNMAGTADDEVGMAGWTIFLDQDADGVLDAGERSAVTNAEGRYSFSVTPDADPSDRDNDAYVVREVQQTGWVQTSMNPEGIVITAMNPKAMNVDFGNQQPMPSLNIVKDASVPGGTANVVGEVITYTITVQNTGNQMLTGVTVSDPMISDLMLVADAASADSELDVGESWTWTGTHVVTQADIDAGGYIVNVATADSNQTGPDTDDASVMVEQTAALNIVKDASVAGGTANAAGEVIDYTIAVSNTGNQTLTGVTVADPFISNLTLVADAASADGELDVGETWSYTASHVVTQAEIDAGTPIVNVATADSNQTGPDTDDASVTVEQSAALNIVKDASVAGGTADAAGEVIDYTIAVSNTGNQTLTGVTVADPFISNLVLVADAASADGELDVGETWSYTASHVVTQAEIDAGGNIVNVATADSNQTDPDTDDASVAVEQTPGLNIVKDASVAGGTANAAGEVIDYTISVQNTGNQTLTGVTVVDPFASNLLLVADAASADGELDVGETWSYTASHVVTQAEIDAGSPIVNVATADSEQTGPDTDDASVAVEQTPGLNIVKDASVAGGSADSAGEVIAYAISVQNTGNQTLTGVTVADPFISNLVLVADAASADGELDVGETWSYTASHVVTQAEIDAGTPIVNVATADSNQTGPDTDDASVVVEQTPGLNIVKDASVAGGTANAAGEVIDYTIAVSNTGNQTLTGVTVADPFISNLVLVADAASADGELDVGETWSYTASHVVTQAEIDAGTPIVNVATADSNQTGPDTDDASVSVEQSAALNIVKDASVAGGTADAAGEVIDYTIAVSNTGNQTLTGVTVADPFISNLVLVADAASADGELDVGETWSYTASHVVTQAEIDAGGNIVNVATADSNQTDPDTDDASVAVEQTPGLNIVKDASVAGGTANAAGEVIDYTISVQNTGNQTLTGVTVVDPFASNLLLVADAASADGELDVGETWSYTASHAVTQAEMDAGTPIVNVATADSIQTGPDTDDASVAVEQAPAIAVDKAIATITGGNGNTSADAAGDVLNYTITVSNPGNVTLTDVTVVDVLTGLNTVGLTLAPGQSQTYMTSYVLTQQDLDSNGGGDGYIENTATADSAQTSAVSDVEPIQVLPRPSLSLNKSLVAIIGGNGNSIADAAGDVLQYTATVVNEGTVTLTNVSVTDVDTGLNVTGLTLAPGQSAVYDSSYILTQADVDSNGDGDGYHDNIATADSDQTDLLSDAESTPLLRTIGLGVEKNVSSITGGNNNGFADLAGESLNYTIRVYNAGTVTLTNVTVLDDLTGLSQTIASLAPGANQLYQTSYTLTQADLDSNGGGNGYIENSTVVDSDQTLPGVDNETVQLIRSPVLYLDKTFVNVTGGNGNNLIDAVGDVLNYRIVVANPSNVTLTEVSIAEPLTGLTVSNLTLAPGQIETYLTSYTLTQADIDNNGGGDGYIDNVAVADSAQTESVRDIESVPVLRSIGMDFDKGIVGINGGNGNDLADAAGDVLNYVFTVSNPGSVTLTNLTVVDDLTGMSETLASLAPGATVTYNSSYVLTQADLDSNAGGDGVLINTATADTSETPVFTDSEGVTVVYQPIIDLTKYVSVDNGATWDDANGPTGPLLSSASGIDPQFRYTVTNSGNITLGDVTLTDAVYDLNGAEAGGAYSFGSLAVGATAEFIFTGAAWAEGQQSGDAAVSVAAMPLVLDIDNAYYLGV
ncbi:beta strand repeat-containing protein [Limnohabitans sp. yimb22184]|uniref:beta strand repeat-containing protein n=1 Tax=Limnohabitans sp. YIMB22184 TaxID=3374104 RepID=UPI003A898665